MPIIKAIKVTLTGVGAGVVGVCGAGLVVLRSGIVGKAVLPPGIVIISLDEFVPLPCN